MLDITKYVALKTSLRNLFLAYPGKYILRALGELFVELGDKYIMQAMKNGDQSEWKRGEGYCTLGKEVKDLCKKYETKLK